MCFEPATVRCFFNDVICSPSSLHKPDSQTLSLECPPAVMMCNVAEADPFIIDITLMFAEQQITAPPPPVEVKKRERARLVLAELLQEQDQGQREIWGRDKEYIQGLYT